MDRFVHRENLRRYELLLAAEKDPAKRALIERLLAEEHELDDPPGQARPASGDEAKSDEDEPKP